MTMEAPTQHGAPNWRELTARQPRSAKPRLLQMAVREGIITDAHELGIAIEDAWTRAEWPERSLDAAVWTRMLFARIGTPSWYLHDDEIRENRGVRRVPLYRGAIEERRVGMSWTTNLQKATWFAERFVSLGKDPGHVYTIEALPTDALLAKFNRRGEYEVVLDPVRIEQLIQPLR